MTRANRITIVVLLVAGWCLGTLLSISAEPSLLGIVVNAVGTAGAVITLMVVLRGGVTPWAWAGCVLAVVACALGSFVPESPVWPAGVCWVFVIIAGIVASYADTVLDGAMEVVAGGIAVLPLVPLARLDATLWIVCALVAGAVNVSIMFGHRHRTAERRLVQARTEVAMAERTAMARELHDVIAHEVTGIVVLAQAGIAAGADPHGVLARIERSGARALTDIRAMVDTLRDASAAAPARAPSASGASGLGATLAGLADDGVAVAVAPEADADDVPDLVRLVAHRIIAEGITNARRHAPGSPVQVTVGRSDGALDVDVTDDGAVAGAPPGPVRAVARA
ncbi:sensor histidine kinase [Tsukamurella sp. PLM1]|uniref:sensor histidine kinase n=1 Tax=Tsukamurella sp. PLM1 TaxID=2929795 RepID=UPI0020483A44|nr:histidine kinase [Tsukamurella sp. PLM1]BDH58762.1 hypothetical protein MTP03_37010 [Tsukamurella sp. PLM1]